MRGRFLDDELRFFFLVKCVELMRKKEEGGVWVIWDGNGVGIEEEEDSRLVSYVCGFRVWGFVL
jgi:hypothetical protein